MPISAECLPVATPLDPAEEPPGSLDPLGTLLQAERLAEVLLPGFTVRMWRARLLTFAAVASAIADRSVTLMDNRDDLRLEARLAFERLFVSAVVRAAMREPSRFGNAARRLPGRDLATGALLEGEPLTRANFLKGQAVNGPFGVIARLARQLELVDDDGRMGRNAITLLMAWAEDEQLHGVLDEENGAKRQGAAWMSDGVKMTANCASHHDWPGGGHRIWEQLVARLRPDQIGPKERSALLQLVNASPVRRRMIELLKRGVHIYHEERESGKRGDIERAVLLRAVQPELGNDPIDSLISSVITVVDTYEHSTGLFQQAFEGLVWALKVRGGRARVEAILGDTRVRRHMDQTRNGLRRAIPSLERAVERMRNQPSVNPIQIVDPILRIREDALRASNSNEAFADALLTRHERVQREKGKAPWIQRDSYWTLMPGENRVSADALPILEKTYLHPFKIQNAYAFLGDLGQVRVEDRNAEE